MGRTERRLPPVAELAVATMVLVIVSGIEIAAFLPRTPPLGLPIVLLGLAVGLLVANGVLLSRLRDFAWDSFVLVGKWTLLAYIVIAGILEYVFILDHTPGEILILLTVALAVYAIDIPVLFAFSVARYQPARTTGPDTTQRDTA